MPDKNTEILQKMLNYCDNAVKYCVGCGHNDFVLIESSQIPNAPALAEEAGKGRGPVGERGTFSAKSVPSHRTNHHAAKVFPCK